MWHLNLGYPAPRPVDLEWDAAEEPRGVVKALERPLKWALFNHGVDLMGTGGMLSSAHTTDDIDRTIKAFRSAVGDLRAEGLLN
jgi:glutamate-1-semialdehyde aminotransferase